MMSKHSRQLLCTFSDPSNVENDLRSIGNVYKLVNGKIFSFCNQQNETEIYLTYQIIKTSLKSKYPRTIGVHRKRETNTIYTLNAMNTLITNCNSGVFDRAFQLNWQAYKNTIILAVEGEVKITGIKYMATPTDSYYIA